MTKKYNLTIIDKNPDIKNFIYAGVTKLWVDKVEEDFKNQKGVIHFEYDEGKVFVSISEIHSIVISDYISIQEMEEPVEDDL
jgi:hypothetical protein